VKDRRQTDRQTDHATEKRVATGGIAGAARAISPDNNKKTNSYLRVIWKVCYFV